MSKYSNEFKLKVVKYCIEKYHSSYEAAKEFNIPSPTPIKHWIRKYNEHGEKIKLKLLKIKNIIINYFASF